jgi:hypothetical protein
MPCLSLQRGIRLVALACALLAGGCSGNEGPKTYRVSGTVTFDGQPIPMGTIVFTPDFSKQNDGTQGVAAIKDGKYDTQVTGGMGTVGGPMKVSLTGLTAEERPLCQYDFDLDLPREDTTKDIEVPKSAASRATQFEGP